MTAELEQRCDRLQRVGTDLLHTLCVEDLLAQSGAVHRCGSFFLGLALRPEIDFLLLTDAPPDHAARAIHTALRHRLGGDDGTRVVHRRVQGSAGLKHFVVAHLMWPQGDASATAEQWTIDVAVWNRAAWLATHGEPRPAQLDHPLTTDERSRVLAWKAAADNGTRPKVDTRQLCERAQRGEALDQRVDR